MKRLNSTLKPEIGHPQVTQHQLAFGGVFFELVTEPGVEWRLPERHARQAHELSDERTIAAIRGSVALDQALPNKSMEDRVLALRQDGAHTIASMSQLTAELSEVGPRQYAATARVAAGPLSMQSLLFALSAAVVQRLGGLHLHAAGVELDGRAVLFLGPSGAGKSTAAQLTSGTRLFACDRASIAPDRDGRLWAFSLPGGLPFEGALPSERVSLPLGALVRVRQGRPGREPLLRRLEGAASFFAVREAVEMEDETDAGEGQRLRVIEAVCARTPVLEVHTVLERPITAMLRAALQTQPRYEMPPSLGVAP